MSILDLVLLIVIILTIVYLVKRFWKRKKDDPNFEWKPLSGETFDLLSNQNPNVWTMIPNQQLYYLWKSDNEETGEKFGVIYLNQGFDLKFKTIPSNTELMILSYPSFSVVRSFYCPLQITLRIPEELPIGRYIFILRTTDQIQSYSFRDIRPKDTKLIHNPPKNDESDELLYEEAGEVYAKINAQYENDGLDYSSFLVSDHVKIYPDSGYTQVEQLTVRLEPNERCFFVIPNRLLTLQRKDCVVIDGQEMEVDVDQRFNIFELDGRTQDKHTIRQFIYGMKLQTILPIYGYIYKSR